jgi:hypothetical protein
MQHSKVVVLVAEHGRRLFGITPMAICDGSTGLYVIGRKECKLGTIEEATAMLFQVREVQNVTASIHSIARYSGEERFERGMTPESC